MNPHPKILFDTDIGSDIDDALALLLLLRLREVELVGVTTVYGDTLLRAKVAKKILDAAGVSVPVVAGIGEPFASPMEVWHAGTEGDGVLNRTEREATAGETGIGTDAPAFIARAVETHGKGLTLVCLGALTNLAAMLRERPELAERVGRVYFMGGGVTYPEPVPVPLVPGQGYPANPSHNIRCDVGAAREVFASGISLTVLTNDVTTRVWWDGPPVQRLLQARQPPEAEVVGRLLKVWLDYRSRIFEREITGTCPHDPLTIAEAAGYHFTRTARGWMTPQEDASTRFVPDDAAPHTAAVHIHRGAFLEWVSQTLGLAE